MHMAAEACAPLPAPRRRPPLAADGLWFAPAPQGVAGMFVPAGMMFYPGGPQLAQPPAAKYFSIDVECVATGTGACAWRHLVRRASGWRSSL